MKLTIPLLRSLQKHQKKIWITNVVLMLTYFFSLTPGHLWLMSISEGNIPKPFTGAMMPLAFVPDWQKSNYIERRHDLKYSEVNPNDLIPLPKISKIKSDTNSFFTYITMFTGKYMDEERYTGVGSHDGIDIRAPLETPIFAIANGRVVKARDDDNNRYVTLEHRDVSYRGTVGKYYSSYLHLGSLSVQVGDTVAKGTMIGRVGMSGFTTTPHLHIQIDNEESPFQPYWPFTLTEAGEAGMSFFDAVDNGLGKSQILKYSVDPIDFIENARGINQTTTSNPVTPTPPSTNTTTPLIKVVTDTFPDVGEKNPYKTAITYLAKKGILSGYTDGKFHPENKVTRSEVLGIVLNSLNIPQHGEILVGVFRDIPRGHWVNPLVSEAIRRNILNTKRPLFEPNREVTRVEFLAILALSAGETITDTEKKWKNINQSHWSHKYAEFGLKYNLLNSLKDESFHPTATLSRGEIADAIYRYLAAKQKI